MIKTGIYKFENKINNKIYVGQSTNINKRYFGHLYDALNRPDKGSGVDPAILKYGIENFDFTILEECDVSLLDEKEIQWIAYYDSYHKGYNRTPGGKSLRGEEHPRAILTEKDVWIIREMYAKHYSRREVYAYFKETGITQRGFKKVRDGENWPLVHIDVYTKENRLWHKNNTGHSKDQIGKSSLDRAIKQDEIDLWVMEYNNGLSINAIAKKV